MAKIYIFIISLLTALVIYLITNSTMGIIIGIVTALLLSAIPFGLDLLKDKNSLSNVFATIIGMLLAFLGFAAVLPMLHNFQEFIQWIVLSIMTVGISYAFYKYQQEIGFQLASGPGKPGEVIEPMGKIVTPKILDTSIVIDGRIIDLASTGFIEGPLVVPNFVLREIQLISDSADAIKRNRGRRGLDMLNTLQKRPDLEVKISYIDYTETREVDAKLIRLAKELGGKLITNDFNLNKVAELQDIDVLNINNLANALKPVVLPGEEMEVQVVKDGKDENQGIGYLDDGTMVVIENGGKMLGKKLKVNVTSVIQTNAGKMIFTKVVAKN